MYAQVDKPSDKKYKSITDYIVQNKSDVKPNLHYVDNRSKFIAQRKNQLIENGNSVMQAKVITKAGEINSVEEFYKEYPKNTLQKNVINWALKTTERDFVIPEEGLTYNIESNMNNDYELFNANNPSMGEIEKISKLINPSQNILIQNQNSHGMEARVNESKMRRALEHIPIGKLSDYFNPELFDVTHEGTYHKDAPPNTLLGNIEYFFKWIRNKHDVQPRQKRTGWAAAPESYKLRVFDEKQLNAVYSYGASFEGVGELPTFDLLNWKMTNPPRMGKTIFRPAKNIESDLNKLTANISYKLKKAKEENASEEKYYQIAAEFKQIFIAIHPYMDGNGRVSRIISDRILAEGNIAPVNWQGKIFDLGMDLDETAKEMKRDPSQLKAKRQTEPGPVANNINAYRPIPNKMYAKSNLTDAIFPGSESASVAQRSVIIADKRYDDEWGWIYLRNKLMMNIAKSALDSAIDNKLENWVTSKEWKLLNMSIWRGPEHRFNSLEELWIALHKDILTPRRSLGFALDKNLSSWEQLGNKVRLPGSEMTTRLGKEKKVDKEYLNSRTSELAENHDSEVWANRKKGERIFPYEAPLTREGKKQLKVVQVENKLYFSQSKKLVQNGHYKYVISPKGGMYIWKEIKDSWSNEPTQDRSHGTIRNHQPVQSAGYVRVEGGYIKEIDSMSGHYKPTDRQFLLSMKGLQNAGFIKEGLTKMVTPDFSTGEEIHKVRGFSELDNLE